MDTRFAHIAEQCLRGAEHDTMTFPQIVATLTQEGFESYSIDCRRANAIYYRTDGGSVELATHQHDMAVAEVFDIAAIRAAIREAQQLVSGYTYKGFCRKIMSAGCAGYLVSFTGRRALYFGRTAEVHVEHFPK